MEPANVENIVLACCPATQHHYRNSRKPVIRNKEVERTATQFRNSADSRVPFDLARNSSLLSKHVRNELMEFCWNEAKIPSQPYC